MPASSPSPKVDALGKVTGATHYPGDLTLDNLLHGKVLFSGQPHARMVFMNLDKARAVPGVVAIFTAADVPTNEYGLILPDQPVLVGLGSAKVGSDISRWEGDQIAFIVAETEETATLARSLVEVEWEPLPRVTDVRQGMTNQVLVHAHKGSNILTHYKIRKGDMLAGWSDADVVVTGTYTLPVQEHAYLQPEAGVGYIDGEGRITVAVAGQWTHEDQAQIAHALGVATEQIRVLYPAIGGAFGGREDLSIQIVLGLAAMCLRKRGIDRPVRVIWSREESMIGHHKRHHARIRTKWGATHTGKLTAMETELILDAGSYAYTSTKVIGNAHMMVAGPYEIPNAHIDSYAVYTNNTPGGAFRGFGGPQAAFAAESQMNKLADLLSIDPVELRLKNILHDGSETIVQTPLPKGVSLDQVVKACAQEAYWGETPEERLLTYSPFHTLPASPSALRRGRGMACAFKNIGFSFGFSERCEATVELHGTGDIERVVLRHAGADVGQGSHTVFKQMTAMSLDIPESIIELDMSDTASSGDAGSASASRMTWMAGNAIRQAAEKALKAWQAEDRPAIGHTRFTPPATQPYDPETGKCYPNNSYGYVAEIVDVVVDVETGHIYVEQVVCADDVGRVLNRNLIEGQVEGAIAQAMGYTLMENLQIKDGYILNPYLSTYLIPGIMDVPAKIQPVLLEIPDPLGPWGARGMAEMPFMPFAPALTAAIHQATGVWFDELPLTPDRVVQRLYALPPS